MYKLLLCWRYLRTRYIALASIISVMLGVATMIVVNSVMSGFTTEMQDRIHGILSDVTFDSLSLEGMRDAEWHMAQIEKVAGESIAGMTPTVRVPAMLDFRNGNNWITRKVQLIGIDENTQSDVSDFGKYLQHEANRSKMSFELRDGGYDMRDHQAGPNATLRKDMEHAGWPYRRRVAEAEAFYRRLQQPDTSADPQSANSQSANPQSANPASGESTGRTDPFAARPTQGETFDPAQKQHTGVVLGIALASYRTPEGEDSFLTLPGADVKLTFPTAGRPPKPIYDTFTIVDFYECKMSEYDASFVFVPIRALQELRGMWEYQGDTKQYFVNSIQIKLKPGADGAEVRDRLRKAFSPELYGVYTWRDKQGLLLEAVRMETAILNVLLFLIIAVAGFGILAIFLMIVVEKTKDIGILKSLGASRQGIMGIFLAYGLALGLVGSGGGLVLGLLFVRYINKIADLLGWIMGERVFSPEIYYFQEIPTIVSPMTIVWIVAGAMTIAVLASILPALRAALLHPVEALRVMVENTEGIGGVRPKRRALVSAAGSQVASQPQGRESTEGNPRSPLQVVSEEQAVTRDLAHVASGPHVEIGADQLAAVGLTKSYRKGAVEVPVLTDLDLTVRPGEFLAIVGQSGCGKSTLLHLLGTLDAPDAGEIHFRQTRIDNLPAVARDTLRNKHFGMIFQFYHLLPELTTLENVLMPLMIAQSTLGYLRRRRRHRRAARELLEMVGLGHRLKHKPRELSGGEMQRAAIARALVAGPDLLLADEPTGNLDRGSGRDILSILRTLNRQQGLTVVMVTHDQAIAEQADRVVRLADGRIKG